MISAKVVAK